MTNGLGGRALPGRLKPEARRGWDKAEGDLWPPLPATARRGDLLKA